MKEPELSEWEDKLLWSLNQSTELDVFTEEEIMAQGKDLPRELLEQRRRDMQLQIEWIRFGLTLAVREGWGVPKCSLCGKFFIAKRKTLLNCPACAKKLRQRNWRERYEKDHGHPYRQKREAAYVKKVRQALENWKDFEPTLENKKDLAAEADITLKQCEIALEIISDEKKRAQTARKR